MFDLASPHGDSLTPWCLLSPPSSLSSPCGLLRPQALELKPHLPLFRPTIGCQHLYSSIRDNFQARSQSIIWVSGPWGQHLALQYQTSTVSLPFFKRPGAQPQGILKWSWGTSSLILLEPHLLPPRTWPQETDVLRVKLMGLSQGRARASHWHSEAGFHAVLQGPVPHSRAQNHSHLGQRDGVTRKCLPQICCHTFWETLRAGYLLPWQW